MNEHWNTCTINDLGTINRGRSKHRPRNDAILFGGDYPFIQTGDVKKANLYITEYSETYNEEGLAQSKLWEKGTLCITIAANIAETAILGIDACFPDSVVGFIPFEGVADTRYVKYMMDMFKVYMQQISKGTTQDNLSLEKIKRVKFEAPRYEIQKRIADVLSRYDLLIEANIEKIRKLEKVASEIFNEWFIRGRFPGYENCKFDESMPRGWQVNGHSAIHIPTSWHFGEFRELGEFSRGKNITAEKMIPGDVPVISAGLEPSGLHNEANVFGRSITVSASGANAGYLKYHFHDIWAADCSYFQSDSNFWYVLNMLKFLQPVISNMQVGAAQPHVYPKNINRLSVLIPGEVLMRNYGELVAPIYKKIDILDRENTNLKKQRELLIPRLMSGKLKA